MTAEVLAFLGGAPGPISLFEAWEEAVLACGESTIKVSKTQISWGNPLQFAVLSQPRRAAQRRAGALMATLGLGRRVEHPRILQAVEPYPGRWRPGWPRPTALPGKNRGAPDPRRASVRLAINPPAKTFGGRDSVKGCPAGRFGAQPPLCGGAWRGDEPSGFPFAFYQTTL